MISLYNFIIQTHLYNIGLLLYIHEYVSSGKIKQVWKWKSPSCDVFINSCKAACQKCVTCGIQDDRRYNIRRLLLTMCHVEL